MPRLNNTTSNADRERIVNSYINGEKVADISRIMNINRTTVHGIIDKYIKTGVVIAGTRGGVKPCKLNAQQKDEIKSWIDVDCSLSLKKIKEMILENFNLSISTPTIARIIDGFNYSLKRISLVPERRNDPDVIASRQAYALKFISLPTKYSEEELIFIDEVGFNVSMRCSYGRSAVGTPANKIIANIRSRNISICCSINKNGILLYESKITPYNTTSFSDYIASLIIILRDKDINSGIFILDNVRFHKNENIKMMIENEGYEILFLPAYSPFLNPIENMFSKWKEISKRANPMNETELMESINDGANLITSSDCQNYFRHMHSYIPRCLNCEVLLN